MACQRALEVCVSWFVSKWDLEPAGSKTWRAEKAGVCDREKGIVWKELKALWEWGFEGARVRNKGDWCEVTALGEKDVEDSCGKQKFICSQLPCNVCTGLVFRKFWSFHLHVVFVLLCDPFTSYTRRSYFNSLEVYPVVVLKDFGTSLWSYVFLQLSTFYSCSVNVYMYKIGRSRSATSDFCIFSF